MKVPESLGLSPRYEADSSWWEHVPLAHMLVEILKPKIIVELGTHYGVSLFSFCEAAEIYSTDTYIYAVDTWSGDKQAGFYDEDVYERVSRHRNKYHKDRCQLMRTTFEDAALKFGDETIDIIHIDGLHTYEAVKADYKTWKKKLRKGGSILFHDWNVRERDFGVWKLWESIKNEGAYQCIEFPNGYGLGIATLNETKPEWHDMIEDNFKIIQCKGLLLDEINSKRNRILEKEDKIDMLERHIANLKEININQGNSIMSYEHMMIKRNWIRRLYEKMKYWQHKGKQ